MKTRQFWYPLPERLIAQHPAEKRGTEKMMVLHRATGVVEHRHIADIVEYITANDLLVVNDTKVFPARLIGEWPDTHGAIELLMVNAAPMDADDERPSMTAGTDSLRWNCIIGSGRKCREGQVASFGPAGELKATLVKPLSGIGMWQVEFSCDRPLMDLLDEFGRTPVPPYVKREGTAEEEKEDRERYQTIYAREVGSVAAPTAGLHFTPEIFAALDAKGVRRVAVTLHVGPGTFRPVKADNIEDHHMDFEAFTVPPETAEAINECKARGGRIFCVGSTTVRTLETVAAAVESDRVNAGSDSGGVESDRVNAGSDSADSTSTLTDPNSTLSDSKVVVPCSGASDIFIYPPYRFRVCDCMLTNFHLPQSTLLMMISALAGRERVLCSYALAVRNNYMFFSYGDCMLIV
ncbi:MAG: S-adenosylmethionine:tRNA ribosyltransferase-isomerase [Kiritimatiellae bacterium]|nr:S-adenosylmethionine:tRNA ribosyltransferase-isomerase [Kiritimatiellia bacterium]